MPTPEIIEKSMRYVRLVRRAAIMMRQVKQAGDQLHAKGIDVAAMCNVVMDALELEWAAEPQRPSA